MTQFAWSYGIFAEDRPADDMRPARRGPLSVELRDLSETSRRVWGDSAERLRIVGEILDAEMDGDIARMNLGLNQIDMAITEALGLLELPRGPIKELAPVWGRRYAGRKLPDCTLQINMDLLRRLSAVERGLDTTFRTWVHESIHGRQPYEQGHKQEYVAWSGYEEGLAEALARQVVRCHAGLDPIEPRDYNFFLAAYLTLSEAMDVDAEMLLRTLWSYGAGRVRIGLVDAVDDLRRARSVAPLSNAQRIGVARTADVLFATVNLNRSPSRTTMLTLWRGRTQ